MAQSRLEKVGTIYDRVTSLIKAGAMKEEARPLWVDIYKAFPPKYEPRYDRPTSLAPIRQIFYSEDQLRARFHKEYKHFSMVNLLNNKVVSKTEQFLMIYKNLEKTGIPKSELYDKAIQEFVSKFNTKDRSEKSSDSSTIPKDAKANQNQFTRKSKPDIDMDHLFNELKDENNESEVKKAKDGSELTAEEKAKYRPIRLSMEKIVEIMKKEDKKPE